MNEQDYEIYKALDGKSEDSPAGAADQETPEKTAVESVPETGGPGNEGTKNGRYRPKRDKKPKSFGKGVLTGVLVTLGVMVVAFVCVFFLWGQSLVKGVSSGGVLSSAAVTKIELLEKMVDKYYLHDYTTDDMREGMYAGLIEGLGDKYTVYYNQEETKELEETTSGSYSGIGAVFTQDKDTNIITCLSVYGGSPAEEAGMAAGDILYKVNGEDITEKSLTDVVKNIKGEEGTTVDLTLYRDGQEMTITATRRSIEIQTVSYKMMDNQIGYIKVTEFEETTLDQFKKAKEDLTAQGAAGLVIDLRDNPGGNVDTVCDMLDELLPQGLIVYTKDKDGNVKNYYSKGDDTLGMPLTVLVNENSASASEIFSGAVQDRGIGTIVGTTTYGKGVMQSVFDLKDGTAIKITTFEYFTPNGRSINGVGITPNVEVADPSAKDSADETTDTQLQKALEITKNAM